VEKTYHFCLLAKREDCRDLVLFDPRYLYHGNCGAYTQQANIISEGKREYSVDCANEVIRAANEAGYLVTYNHPCWSQQDHSDYIGLKGLWGVEVYNSACNRMGYDDNQPHIYDDLLRHGEKLFPVAADDTHEVRELFGGWLMVAAKTLSYGDVMEALEKGDFYATSGPEIYSMVLEGSKLKIACSPCRNIHVTTHLRYSCCAEGESMCQTEFDMRDWLALSPAENGDKAFFRVTLEDQKGRRAYTRAYFRREVELLFGD